MLISHSRIRASTARTDGYEIECSLGVLEGEGGGSRVSVWAPIEQLSILRPGTIFQNRVISGTAKALVERQATRLQANQLCQLSDNGLSAYAAIGHRPLGSAVTPRPIQDYPIATVCEHAGRRIYIRAGELLRFYFGPVSWLADGFMSAAHSPPGTGLVDLDASGMVEPEVMQIAPVAGLTDRSSALHLAMLLNSPDLMTMWQAAAADMLGSFDASGEGPLPPAVLAAGQHSYALLGHTVPVDLDHYGERQERAFVAAAILSDFRPAPFKRLIVKLPHGTDELDVDDPDAGEPETSSRYRTIISRDAALESHRRPGLSVGGLSPFPESLRRAFPRLGRIEIKYEIARRYRRGGSRQTSWNERTVDSLSALSPGSDASVGGVILRPGPSYRAAPAEPGPPPSDRLLERQAGEVGQFAPYDRQALSYPLSVFASAIGKLGRHQSGGLVGQDPLRGAAGKVMLLQAHPSWGSAWRDRQFAVGHIQVSGRRVYAFEVSRRRKTERISLGLVARRDGGLMSVRELSAIAEHAISKLSSRPSTREATWRGVWPVSYSDVRARIVPHTARRRLSALLAEDLEALARTLFDPPVALPETIQAIG